ncbi:hypothetical protein DYB31_002564 [Aphanomyces astaci]|uniref:PH domain-containing protein n=2 Tax=Aphanomyces astaci TaxID=112090 RepID=A0A397F6M1_APHAT|nr:hypothetical protein DYB31_002564 [Aphanomyces astaci]
MSSATDSSHRVSQNSGKSALLREILQASEPTEGEQSDGATHPADVAVPPADISYVIVSDPQSFYIYILTRCLLFRSGVWMYVQETAYAHAKRVVYLDVQCYGDNEGLDARLFGIVSFLSSNVIHCSVGHINEHVFDEMNFLQSAVHVLGDRPGLLPALTWIVRDLSSKDVKAAVPSADPASDIDQQYLEAVLNPKSSPFTSSLSWQILTSFFPKRIGAILPPTSSPAYSKKVLRVRKSLVEPSHVKEVRGVALHGSIFCHIMALLCASPSNITSEFPCDEGDVKTLHVAGKAAAQPFLAKAGALGDDLAALAARLFHELSAAHVAKWMDENDRASSAQCLSVLQRLHTDIEHLIKAKLQPQDDNNPLRLVDFKAILRAYQHSVQNMVVEYASEAVGPQKMAALSQFYSTVVPRFIEYLAHLGDQTMHRQTALVEVERTAERVLEVSQATQEDERALEGYLIKQGGGGVFGRKNWKQRNILSYAKTKDDYERGKILKEFSIVGSVIKDSADAGEGFEVWPPSTGQAVYDYKQGLFGSDPTLGRRKVDGDSERIFYLRASTMEVKEQWVERLRRAVILATHAK